MTFEHDKKSAWEKETLHITYIILFLKQISVVYYFLISAMKKRLWKDNSLIIFFLFKNIILMNLTKVCIGFGKSQ
jgi:hypothetical protein